MEGNRPFINLDNGASTPIWKAVCQTLRQPRQVQRESIHNVLGVFNDLAVISRITHR